MIKRYFSFYRFWPLLLLLLFSSGWYLIDKFYDQQVINQQERYLANKGELFLEIANQKIETLESFIQLKSLEDNERLTVLDEKGNILFDSFDPNLSGQRSDRPEVQAILKNNTIGRALRMSPTLNKKLLYIALPIKKEQQMIGILRLAEPLEDFWPAAKTMKQGIFYVYLLLCSLFSLLLYQVLRQKNRPLEIILPVLNKMIADPEHTETIIANSPQWENLYQSINQLSEQMSQNYRNYRATEKQFYYLLEELTIGVFLINAQHELVFANQTLKNQFDLKTKVKLPTPFEELFHDAMFIQMIYQLSHTQPFLQQKLITGSTNLRLDLSLRYFPETQQILGVSYDFTRIHQLEQMQKDFVANVSHELKTPVTSLIGFTETLLDGAKEEPEILTQFLQIMQKDAYRLEKLIQEILLLSKGEGVTFPEEEVLLIDFFQQLITRYESVIQEKELQVELKGEPTLTLSTKLDLFYPIFKNLFENALNYSFAKGSVTICFEEHPSSYLFVVQDTGIGISKEEQSRVFERFYRADKARSRLVGGSGIGLAIVKDYIARLEGTITLESYLGVGSRFEVQLPKTLKDHS